MSVQILITISLLLIMLLVTLFSKKEDKFEKYDFQVPKTIWTYWHETTLPPLVKACIESWRRFNPKYEIIVLNNKIIEKYIDFDLEKLNIHEGFHARYADYARLLVVLKYGGIWMDSTIICTQSLKWVHDIFQKEPIEFLGYSAPQSTNEKYKFPENWFFAAVPNSKFIQDWLNEALKMNTFKSEREYISFIKKNKNFDFQNLEKSLPYLSMHLCASVIIQKNKKYNMKLLDPLKGPFKYLFDNKWEIPLSLEKLCIEKDIQTPIIKLRGVERRFLEQNSRFLVCDKAKTNPIIYKVLKSG